MKKVEVEVEFGVVLNVVQIEMQRHLFGVEWNLAAMGIKYRHDLLSTMI